MSVDPVHLARVSQVAQSVEYLIMEKLDRATSAYLLMLNSSTLEAAQAAVRDLRKAFVDLEREISLILTQCGAPPGAVLNVNAQALKVWTGPIFDGLMQNAYHWLQRMMRSRSQMEKVRSLTAVYYLMKDLRDCADGIKAEDYYGKATSRL